MFNNIYMYLISKYIIQNIVHKINAIINKNNKY